jgi:hypothetical protein
MNSPVRYHRAKRRFVRTHKHSLRRWTRSSPRRGAPCAPKVQHTIQTTPLQRSTTTLSFTALRGPFGALSLVNESDTSNSRMMRLKEAEEAYPLE